MFVLTSSLARATEVNRLGDGWIHATAGPLRRAALTATTGPGGTTSQPIRSAGAGVLLRRAEMDDPVQPESVDRREARPGRQTGFARRTLGRREMASNGWRSRARDRPAHATTRLYVEALLVAPVVAQASSRMKNSKQPGGANTI